MKDIEQDIERLSIKNAIKFGIHSLLLLLVILAIALYFFSKIFSVQYEVWLNNTPIGYISQPSEYKEVVEKLETDITNAYTDSKVKLEYEPVFVKVYRNNTKESNLNIYTGTRENLLVEYTVYSVTIGDFVVDFDTKEKASEYIQKIKTNKITKEPIYSEKTTTEQPKLATADLVDSTYKEVVSRYRPIISPRERFLKSTSKPTDGIFTSYFGFRANIYPAYHSGLDIANSVGTQVYAWAAGTVISAAWDGDYGYSILIQHAEGFQTRYAHLSKMLISIGDEVQSGQQIALMGSTGNSTGAHLHFEILSNGRFQDPLTYIKKFY